MKAWEAMLKRAKMGPQLFGILGSKNEGTCALGSIVVGCGVDRNEPILFSETLVFLRRNYLFLIEPKDHPCPVCKDWEPSLMEMIAHINNDHKWSRECIAYWLREIEEPDYAKKLPMVVKHREAVAV